MSIIIHVPDYILFEDDYILVIDKPAMLMVEPDRNGHPNLLNQVKNYLKMKAPLGEEVYAQHIHRIDRPVSGVILFAKKREVLKNLSEQFAERKVRKYYRAITDKKPLITAGTLTDYLRKEKKKAVLYDEPIEYSEKATLEYTVAALAEDRFQWDIVLHTGKYHQIRAQLAKVGCPILGDLLYGSEVSYFPNTIALTASRLIFTHPVTGEELDIEIELKR